MVIAIPTAAGDSLLLLFKGDFATPKSASMFVWLVSPFF